MRFNPAGKVPLVRVQVYGVVPPLAASVALYAMFTSPSGNEVVVIAKVAGVIVSVKLTVFVCAGVSESFTCNVSGKLLAAAVGVPLMTPVELFRFSPLGSVPLVSVQV